MNKQSFKSRIFSGFFIVICISVLLLIIAYFKLHSQEVHIAEFDKVFIPEVLLIEKAALNALDVQQFLTDVSATHDPAGFEEAQQAAATFKSTLAALKNTRMDDQAWHVQLNKLEAEFDDYYAVGVDMAKTYLRAGRGQGNQAMVNFDTRSRAMLKDLDGLKSEINQNFNRESKALVSETENATYFILASIAILLLSGGLVAFFISGKLMAQLGIDPFYAKGIAQEISKGDLSREIRINPGDGKSLLAAIKKMQQNLCAMIRSISGVNGQLTEITHQVAEASKRVAVNSAAQNSAVDTVVSGVERMHENIVRMVSHAEAMEALANKASASSTEGNEVVTKAVTEINQIAENVNASSLTIQQLGESSDRITDVVSVINDIANQTNLLALNAAIEAARAGEQGRGFAVVADEVRQLAERTAQSTQEVAAMIDTIQKQAEKAVESMGKASAQVGIGVQQAQLAGVSIQEIKKNSDTVSQTIGETTQALREQSEVVQDIALESERIATMSRSNSEEVGDVADLSKELQKIAGIMNQSIGQFKV